MRLLFYCLLAAGCCLLATVFCSGTDPVPLRRVLVAPAQVPRELARVRSGTLIKLSAADFAARLKAASAAGRALENPPRLVEASYTATLQGTSLEGNGEWTVASAMAPAILPLPKINLALKGKVQFREKVADAIIGDLDGKSLGLLVNNPGKDSVVFNWTARGDLGPDGRLRFKLLVPPCPVAALELTLPGDRLVGLFPRNRGVVTRVSQDRNVSRWLVRFSGQSEVALVIHRATGPGPLVLTRLETEQTLLPDRVEARFKFQAEVLHNIPRKLYFEYDAPLQPYDVTIQHVDLGWKTYPSSRPGVPHLLVIELREPILNPEKPLPPLSIRCLAPLVANSAWTSPTMRLVKVLPWGKSDPGEGEKGATAGGAGPPEWAGLLADDRLVDAFPRGETLALRIHPDIRLERWHPGNFRLTRTEQVLADSGLARTEKGKRLSFRVLTLVGQGGPMFSTRVVAAALGVAAAPRAPGPLLASLALRAGKKQVRPGALIRTQGFDCLARQFTWWQVGPRASTLTAQITYEVVRGRLFQLHLSLPPGWEVDLVRLAERDSNLDLPLRWTPLGEPARPLLVIDPQRELTSATPVRLTVRLQRPLSQPFPAAGLVVTIPDVGPRDARFRTGGLAITVSPLYRASVRESSVPVTVPDETARTEVPWGSRTPDLYFSYRLRTMPRQAVIGRLRLRFHPPRLRAACTTEVVVASDRASVEVRLRLQPEVGNPSTIDIHVSAPVPGPWRWQVQGGLNYVRQTIPAGPELLALAARGPLDVATVLARPRRGSWWRLVLARPLREPLTLRASFPVAKRLQDVPLVTVPAADVLDGEVTLYLVGMEGAEVKAEGLREAPALQADEGRLAPLAPRPWRTYRYGNSVVPGRQDGSGPFLSLSRRVRAALRSAKEVIDRSRLTTYVQPGGWLLHHFTFRVWDWRDRTLAIRLPAGMRALAVKAYGRWVSLPEQVENADGTVLGLQVASGVRLHRFEIVYAPIHTASGWLPWSHLESPAPILPVRALTFRRTWRFPPGVLPVTWGGLRRLPGAAPDMGFPSVEALLRLRPSDQNPLRVKRLPRRRLAEAEAELRKQRPAEKDWRLGELLERLVFIDYLKEPCVLVVDADALRSAHLGADALPLAADAAREKAKPGGLHVWEKWGLVYLDCRGTGLLTTHRQLELWEAAVGGAEPNSAAVEEAVIEAAVYGHDGSGRFRTVGDWLRGKGPRRSPTGEVPAPLLPDSASSASYADWTTWEPLAGVDEESTWVVRQEVAPTLGLALAVVFLLAAWRLRRRLSPRWRFRLLMAWLALFGLGLFWLPGALRDLAWWPTLLAAALASVWYLWSIAARQMRGSPPTPSHSSHLAVVGPAGALVLALAWLAGLAGQAAVPAPYTVLLLPGTERTPEKQSVLVPPELLKRLDELGQRGARGLKGAVLLSADYRGKVRGTLAEFEADFQVYCFARETTLTLPLGDVVLKPQGQKPLEVPALFAGKAAYPVALPRKGYAVPLQVEEPGTYLLSLRFTARISESGENRELRFTIPRVAQSRLVLELSPGAQDLHDEAGFGTQQVTRKRSNLEVQLGRVGGVHVRWRRPGKKGPPARVRVREMYLWDLSKLDISLSGILLYKVEGGNVARLTVGLPEGIEVRGIEVGLWPPPASGEPMPRILRKWAIVGSGSQRQLLIYLHRPVTGEVRVLLELVPRLLATPGVLPLFLPMPPPDVQTLPGSLAYRVEGMTVMPPETQHLGVTPLRQDTFIQNWRRALNKQTDLGSPTFAYGFLRTSKGAAVLRLTLRPAPVHARLELSWRVGVRNADVRARATVTSPAKDLMLVEWDAPGVTVAALSGPLVRSWTQTGSRVQIWLRDPSAQATFELSGWVALPVNPVTQAGTGRVGKPRAAAPPRPRVFRLPDLRLVAARTNDIHVAIAAAGGVALEPGQLRGLILAPANTRPAWMVDGAWHYRTQQPFYEASFAVYPSQAEVRGFTGIEVRGQHLVFTARLDYRVSQGELRNLKVRLRDWYGDVRLEAPSVEHQAEHRVGRSERTWFLTLRPGISRRYTIHLTGRIPLDSARTLLMPDVRDASALAGTAFVRSGGRWMEAGANLAVVGERGLVRLRGPMSESRVAGPGSRHWKVLGGDWQLRLQPRPASGPHKARLLLVEQAAAVVDGERWLHQAVYWVFLETDTDLHFDLPPGAVVRVLTIDGLPGSVRQPQAAQVWLSLSGGGVRAVRLNWDYPEESESLDSPNLAMPRVETGEPAGPAPPILWTVHVPVGYRFSPKGSGDERGQPDSAASQDLDRAEVQLRLSILLARRVQANSLDPAAAHLRLAQERFFWYCRQAQHRLTMSARLSPGNGIQTRRLQERCRRLMDQNARLESPLLRTIRVEAVARADSSMYLPVTNPGAGRQTTLDQGAPLGIEFLARGRPTYWRVDSVGKPLQLRLNLEQQRQQQQALAGSGLVLAALLLAWGLSCIPLLPALVQMTWPEQLVLVGWLVVWRVGGLPEVGVPLMALGGMARLYLLTRWLLQLLWRRTAAASANGGHVTAPS